MKWMILAVLLETGLYFIFECILQYGYIYYYEAYQIPLKKELIRWNITV